MEVYNAENWQFLTPTAKTFLLLVVKEPTDSNSSTAVGFEGVKELEGEFRYTIQLGVDMTLELLNNRL